MRINNFLVQTLGISKTEALQLIAENRVFVNKIKAIPKQFLLETDLIELDNKKMREPVIYKYYAFYKPRGIECTLNPNIENNLLGFIPSHNHLYPVGRLDKQSEGLLLMTNDGKLYQKIALSESLKEKEYEVTVNSAISDEQIQKLAEGVLIMRTKITRPAIVTRINSNSFCIILTQGLNRQIRRMCHTLGLEVTELKRIRIAKLKLNQLLPGEFKEVQVDEI